MWNRNAIVSSQPRCVRDGIALYGYLLWPLPLQVHDWQSVYQSTTIPIPRFERVDQSMTFIGRLANEILRMTDTRYTTYVDQMSAWYDKKTNMEILNLKLWHQLKVKSYSLAKQISPLKSLFR